MRLVVDFVGGGCGWWWMLLVVDVVGRWCSSTSSTCGVRVCMCRYMCVFLIDTYPFTTDP